MSSFTRKRCSFANQPRDACLLLQLREEIELYAQQIAERRESLNEQRADFLLMQFKLSNAEKATRNAEVRRPTDRKETGVFS